MSTPTPRETVTVAAAGAVVHYLEGRSRSGVPVTECGVGLTGGVVVAPGIAGCRECVEVDERKLEQQLADEARGAYELAEVDAEALVESLDEVGEVAHTLLVVPCSATKLEHATVARELYRGTLTTMGLAAATVIERSHLNVSTSILSALHGLLELDEVVAPYDVTFGDSRAITATEIAAQLVARGVQRVVALTPHRYTDALEAACEIAGVELVSPLRTSPSIFEHRRRLAAYRRSAGISSPHADVPDLGLVFAGPVAAR